MGESAESAESAI